MSMNRRHFVKLAACGAGAGALRASQTASTTVENVTGADKNDNGKQFPTVQVIPLPDDKASFQHEGREILRYHFGTTAPKTYCWPLIGPAGRPVIRMGHPHDPVSHRHHRGIWVAHGKVNDIDFWGEDSGSRIQHEAIELYEDGTKRATLVARNVWLSPKGQRVLTERRTLSATPLPGLRCAVDIGLEFLAEEGPVTFGTLPFGFVGVRVAKTMSVADGGGTILNSEGGRDEQGTFWKRARWVNYAGPVAPGRRNGIVLLDHPGNPGHPTHWHTRRDGWMGASFTLKEPYRLEQGGKLKLRYRLVGHEGGTSAELAEGLWKEFAGE
jgi:hypothetical protein